MRERVNLQMLCELFETFGTLRYASVPQGDESTTRRYTALFVMQVVLLIIF
jgi:hypothetical protein